MEYHNEDGGLVFKWSFYHCITWMGEKNSLYDRRLIYNRQYGMKSLLLFLIALIACITELHGQTVPSNRTISVGSMHTPAEPRTISLGESVAASAANPSAWDINPATLAGVDETGADYNQSELYFPGDNHDYYSTGIWMGSVIGTFALHYSYFDQGTWPFTFSSTIVHPFDYTIAASYATNSLAPFSLGASIKLFTATIETSSPPGAVSNATRGIYVDLGLLYSMSELLQPLLPHDTLHAGISLQNIGGDFSQPNISDGGMPYVPFEPVPVGRVLRAGVEYNAPLIQRSNRKLLQGRLSMAGRLLLNDRINNWDGSIDTMPGLQPGIEGYGSAGIEAVVYDVATVRLGIIVYSYDNVYGDEGKRAFRLGLGLNLPLRLIGIDLPLTIGADYSYTDLSSQYFSDSAENNSLDAFGLHVAYTPPAIQ
jgi:hypothetical protein